MAFTDAQVRLLKAKLDPRYIKTRSANGVNLSYVEGWHVIDEANRIFGFDAWDRRTDLNRLRVERPKRAGLRSCLHREGAGQRSCRRHYYCAGRLRNGGRKSFNPRASA